MENDRLKEFNEFLKGRKVAIIGLGVSNLPLIDYMYEQGAITTVFDNRDMDKIPTDVLEKINKYNMGYFFGKDNLKNLVGFNIIFRSPSCMPTIPEIVAEEERGAIVTSEIEMLMKIFPGKIIAVTGSDGKTTTTTLIYEILKANGYNCHVGGNIGTPIFTNLKDMDSKDIVILELSSFQLMHMDVSPDIAVITNVTPNHLNIHKNFQEYIDAKKNIFRSQDKDGILILNYDNDITRKCADEAKGKVIFFSGSQKLDNGYIVDGDIIKKCEDKIRRHILNTKNVKLRGHHNYENIAAALAATETLVEEDKAIKAVSEFTGVEHRLEFVREIDGAKWYNDSIGSSPTRTIAGLKSFDEDIVLIAGGYDKNLDYTPLAKPILDKCTSLVLVGATAQKIYDAVTKEAEIENKTIDIHMCKEFDEIIDTARKVAKPGEIVLFSPASASFDFFKNFEERGQVFKKLVNAMK